MALSGLYLDEPGCPGVLPGLEGFDGRPSRFFGKKTSFSPGSSRSMNRDDPGGSGINRSTAGLSGTGALSVNICCISNILYLLPQRRVALVLNKCVLSFVKKFVCSFRIGSVVLLMNYM